MKDRCGGTLVSSKGEEESTGAATLLFHKTQLFQDSMLRITQIEFHIFSTLAQQAERKSTCNVLT